MNIISKSPFNTQIVSEVRGDGFRTENEKWDDGDKKAGDGWDLETGRNWFGGNLISKDICSLEIWGDGIMFISTYWDDGNITYLRWYKPVIIGFLPSLFSDSKRIAARGWQILQSKMWGLELTFQVNILNYY